jgi:hypothetical protein
MLKHKLVDFIIQFMEEVDKEISEMKLFVGIPLNCGSTLLNESTAECTSKIRGRVVLDASE